MPAPRKPGPLDSFRYPGLEAVSQRNVESAQREYECANPCGSTSRHGSPGAPRIIHPANVSLTEGKIVHPPNEHPAPDIGKEWSLAPVPSSPLAHVRVEDREILPTHHTWAPGASQTQMPLNSSTGAPPIRISSSRPIATTSPSPIPVTTESSFDSHGTSLSPQEQRKSDLTAHNGMLSQPRVPPSPPRESLVPTNPPSEAIDVSVFANLGHGAKSIQHPGPQSTAPLKSSPHSHPEGSKFLLPQNQQNRSTDVIVGTPKPSARTVPISIQPRSSEPKPLPLLLMPGSFAEQPVDVDILPSIRVNPVEPPKTSWYKRLFTRIRHA
jgi:hypothetical protein